MQGQQNRNKLFQGNESDIKKSVQEMLGCGLTWLKPDLIWLEPEITQSCKCKEHRIVPCFLSPHN